MWELHPKHGSLEGVEAHVPPDGVVDVSLPRAMNAKLAHFVGDVGMLGHDHAPIAEGAEVLRGEKRERGRPYALADALHEGLGGILEQDDAILAQPVERGAPPEEIHREDRARSLCDARLCSVHVDVEISADVGEHGCCARVDDGLGGGDERERRDDHLVAFANALGPKRNEQRVAPRRHRDGMRHVELARDLPLERLHLFAEHEPPRAHDARERRVNLAPDGRMKAHEVDESDDGLHHLSG
jgi:hypothetical protein